MPRTKARKEKTETRNSDADSLALQLKEMHRIHDEFEIEAAILWQKQMEEIHDIIHKYRSRFSSMILEMTLGELENGKARSASLGKIERATTVSNDDGYDTQASSCSSRPKKRLQVKKHVVSHKPAISGQTSSQSGSKYLTPSNHCQTMSTDRSAIKSVTPKIQMNTPVSLLRYPKMGETVISMSGSPIIVNGGTTQGVANINIPIADGMFSMQPNAITRVDSDIVSNIDNDTMSQLRQLQANLAVVMNTVRKITN